VENNYINRGGQSMNDVRYMISEASKRVEVEDHVLRYWEEQLVLPIGRNEMGHRYYKESDIELLKTIKHLKEQGFQLKAVKMLLPNLHKLDSLDSQTMIRLKDELNGKVIEMWGEEKKPMNDDGTSLEGTDEETSMEGTDKETGMEGTGMGEAVADGTSIVTSDMKNEIKDLSGDKMNQFKAIMNHIILSALKENNTTLSEKISSNVTDSVVKEMNFLMRLQEEKEEERFKKFDATLRDYQRSRTMAAATLDGKNRKKSKFLKKNKIYI
jgi:DNA-binding transcriptional MerR regulator